MTATQMRNARYTANGETSTSARIRQYAAVGGSRQSGRRGCLHSQAIAAAAAAELLLKSGAVHNPFVDDNDTLPNESENESVVSDDGDVPDSCAPTSLEWPGEAFLYLVGAALTARIWPGFPPPP